MRFHDVPISEKYQAGTFTLTKEEIIEFALKYDPQYMHIDEEKAENGVFKGIIASGMHTLAMTWVQWVQLDYFKDDIIAGVGINNLQFLRPVFPGNQYHVEVETISKEIKNENSGHVTIKLTTYNQSKKPVFAAEVTGLVRI
jgi:acyl dehydratase